MPVRDILCAMARHRLVRWLSPDRLRLDCVGTGLGDEVVDGLAGRWSQILFRHERSIAYIQSNLHRPKKY